MQPPPDCRLARRNSLTTVKSASGTDLLDHHGTVPIPLTPCDLASCRTPVDRDEGRFQLADREIQGKPLDIPNWYTYHVPYCSLYGVVRFGQQRLLTT